jgi:hypothetical protein
MNRMFTAKLDLLANKRWGLDSLFRNKASTKPSRIILLILSNLLLTEFSFDLNTG